MLLITGATGHSGEWFIKMLISEKYDKRIRCTIRETSNTSYLDNSGLDIELVIGDLKDPVFANKALDKITTVVNFTGQKCSRARVSLARFARTGSRPLLRMLRAALRQRASARHRQKQKIR